MRGEVAVGQAGTLAQPDELLPRFGDKGGKDPQASGVGNERVKRHESIIGRNAADS
jgi:hypothetical protein